MCPAAAPVDDESREDGREQRNDERHGHRRHILEVLATEQVVSHAPDGGCEQHNERNGGQQDRAKLTAAANFRGSFFRPNLHIHIYKKGDDDLGSRKASVRDSILRWPSRLAKVEFM